MFPFKIHPSKPKTATRLTVFKSLSITNSTFMFLLFAITSTTTSINEINAQKHSPTQPKAKGASRNLVLQTNEPPDFEAPIGNHTVPLGKDAQLECKISNLGNYRTAWLRVEDKGILTIHNNIITRNYRVGLLNNDEGKNFILTIKNVQPSDKGGYMCQINSVPMKYAIGYLDILTPPVFDDSPTASPSSALQRTMEPTNPDESSTNPPQQQQQQTSQVTVTEGSNATLSCRANGHPAPIITWRREDGQPILLNGIDSNQEQLTKVEGSSLAFNSVHRLNSGAYLCIASNGVQPSASKRLVLDVQYSPVITLPQTELTATLNQQEAKLECIADLNPLGSYHWIKLTSSDHQQPQQQLTQPRPSAQEDDQWLIEHDELVQSDKYEIVIKQITSEKVQMILNIRQIEKKDFAWYKCIAKNTLGIQSNSIKLYESVSFSLNSMFRGGGGGQEDPTNTNENNVLLNDESARKDARPQVLANQQQPQTTRTHTRSSWIQRSSGSLRPNGSSSSSVEVFNFASLNLLLISLLFNCLLIAISSQKQQQQQQLLASPRHNQCR